MISGWICPDALGPEGGGTACLALGCPDDFHAVRLGFPNVTTRPWTLARVIGCASSSFNDYVHPTGDARWTPFTFAMRGRDDDRIVTRPDAPTVITVAGNTEDAATGETANPAWTWTDWVPLVGKVADPATGMRVLMLRALVPGEQTVCMATGQLRGLAEPNELNRGFVQFIGGMKRNADHVTDPQQSRAEPAAVWQRNGLVNGSLFPLVQFLTRKPGIVGIGTGDSHHQGTSTSEQFTGFLYRSMVALGREHFGRVPVGMVNCAAGGLSSWQFFPRLAELIGAVRPSFAILPGWTYNDRTGTTNADEGAADRFFAQLVQLCDFCSARGVTPIVMTPFPRNRSAMTSVRVSSWMRLRQMMLQMAEAGAQVIDAATLLGSATDGVLDGTYEPEMSTDATHPNDRGHSAVASRIIALIGPAFNAAGSETDRRWRSAE